MRNNSARDLPSVGWREWVQLPELGVKRLKAKVDTGARSSSLHASEIRQFEKDGETFVRFKVHTSQRDPNKCVESVAKLIDVRGVRSSTGELTTRTVVETSVRLLGQTWTVELTLADRTEMRFRMLLGREALKDRFLVDAGRSFCSGKPKKSKSKSKLTLKRRRDKSDAEPS